MEEQKDQKPETKTEEVKTPSELDKLKASNDAFEQELVRSRELRAERQKIEAEQMLASTAGQQIPTMTADQVKEQQTKAMADEIVKAFN